MSAIIDYRGKTPRKTTSGVPLITAKIVKGGRVETPTEFVALDEYDAWMRRGLPQVGDVLLTTEAPLGEVAQLLDSRVALAQRIILLRGKSGILNNSYLKFLMMSADVQSQLRGRASGTTVVGIKQSELRNVVLSLPPIEEQRAIAGVLSALDDKIEQNRRTVQTLEKLARAIFRAWFVDFEPVKAKAAGATRFPSMPQAVFDVLPTTFVDSDIGPVPEGWNTRTLGELIQIHDSQRIPLSRRQRDERRGPYPYYGATGVIDYVDKYIFEGDFVLVGEDGTVINDANRPVIQHVSGKFWVNNHAHVLTGTSGYTTEHLGVLLHHVNIRPFVTGAVQPKLNQRNLKSVLVIDAPRMVVEEFGEVIAPAFRLLRQIRDESAKLAEMRDYLLPKLLSGQIRVDNAEATLTEAG